MSPVAMKKIHPALLATIVMAPVLAVQLTLLGFGAWKFSADLMSVLSIDVGFWLLILFIVYADRRRRE
ncbi:hypothetical protein [Microbacterium sp. NPDC087592]|uniref:hypothetical protein n=1 Tax=Microbacterium sp. NPDC087592 TaxID=3364193 RepID=UPI003820CD08